MFGLWKCFGWSSFLYQWELDNNSMQSLHQNRVQAKIVDPRVGFIGKACEEKGKWIGVKVVDLNVFMPKMKHGSMNWPFILEQIQGGGEQNNKRKVMQITSIFMLLNKGKRMVDYEYFKPLFSFLKLKKQSQETL